MGLFCCRRCGVVLGACWYRIVHSSEEFMVTLTANICQTVYVRIFVRRSWCHFEVRHRECPCCYCIVLSEEFMMTFTLNI